MYATHDEDEDGEDPIIVGTLCLSFVGSYNHHDAEEGGATDSAFEENGILEVGYRLRLPHGRLKAGTIRVTPWWNRRD